VFVSFSLSKVLALAKKEIAASEEKKEKEENAVLAALGADGGISRLKSFELTKGAGRGESIAARRKLINVNRLFRGVHRLFRGGIDSGLAES
jgi:hypothetical protein